MKRFTAPLAALATLAVLAVFAMLCAMRTDGHWVYTLDDPYIHLAVAKNFARHGVWGLAPDTHTFCSSSPLWTLLLAGCMKIFGFREWIPGVLNMLCAALVMWRCDRVMERAGLAAFPRLAAGAAILFLAPLTVVASTGMEHCLHILLALCLLTSARAAALAVFSFLAVAARFESLAVVVPLAAALFLEKRRKTAAAVLACGFAPVLLHGFYALSRGGFFLPNSVLLKGRLDLSMKGIFTAYTGVSLRSVHVHILCVLLLVTAGFARAGNAARRFALVLSAACLAHLTFAECGHFYRYEIYLVVPAMLALAAAWLKPGCLASLRMEAREPWRLAARAGLALALCVPLVLRGVWANTRVTRCSGNIYGQQFTVARLFRAMPGTPPVAVNDLGAFSWFCANPVLDLWGLGTTEVAGLKRRGAYDAEAVARLLDGHRAAYIAVFEAWFPRSQIPPRYLSVARLTISGNIACTEDTVRLYADGAGRAEVLRETLAALPLPRGVSVAFE